MLTRSIYKHVYSIWGVKWKPSIRRCEFFHIKSYGGTSRQLDHIPWSDLKSWFISGNQIKEFISNRRWWLSELSCSTSVRVSCLDGVFGESICRSCEKMCIASDKVLVRYNNWWSNSCSPCDIVEMRRSQIMLSEKSVPSSHGRGARIALKPSKSNYTAKQTLMRGHEPWHSSFNIFG